MPCGNSNQHLLKLTHARIHTLELIRGQILIVCVCDSLPLSHYLSLLLLQDDVFEIYSYNLYDNSHVTLYLVFWTSREEQWYREERKKWLNADCVINFGSLDRRDTYAHNHAHAHTHIENKSCTKYWEKKKKKNEKNNNNESNGNVYIVKIPLPPPRTLP